MELHNFFKKNNSKNTTQNEQDFYQKNPSKKFLKIFAAASLALITCATTLLATAPFGSGAASASAESEMTAQEKLAAGTLNLNPETDPVIYTTSSGLDIKFGGATLTSGALNGYTYFTMGNYNGTPINWVIIGRHSSTTGENVSTGFSKSLADFFIEGAPIDLAVGIHSWYESTFETNSPAGMAISNDNTMNDDVYCHGEPYDLSITLSSQEQTSEKIDSELRKNEVLCISQQNIVTSRFYDNSSLTQDYYDSHCAVRPIVVNLYNSNLNFTNSEKSVIIPQDLTTYFRAYSTDTKKSKNEFLFLLSGRDANTETFYCGTYLNSDQIRVSTKLSTTTAQAWWLRSAHTSSTSDVWAVESNGRMKDYGIGYEIGVRPAFVMKLQ